MRSQKGFRGRCENIAEESDIEVYFESEPGRAPDEFEDDGTLHIVRYGLRAMFDVGASQTLTGEKQNERTHHVLKNLGIEPKNAARVFVDAELSDDEEEHCSHCGR